MSSGLGMRNNNSFVTGDESRRLAGNHRRKYRSTKELCRSSTGHNSRIHSAVISLDSRKLSV